VGSEKRRQVLNEIDERYSDFPLDYRSKIDD